VWVVGLVLGAITVYTTTTEANDTPGWLVAASAVLGYISIATNYTADRNVAPTTLAETPPEDRGYEPQAGVADPYGLDERGEGGVQILYIVAAIVVIIVGVIWLINAL
jgi:hypothetical protein